VDARGTLIVATDPAYPPQSLRVKDSAVESVRTYFHSDFASRASDFDVSRLAQRII
jgi:hypothetical protein